LSAQGWFARGITDPSRYGFRTGNLSVTVTLKDGRSFTLDFGLQGGQTALAAVTLDGERWVFVCPPNLYWFIKTYLMPSVQ
ncbi:MAG TPA: hypothetical protein VGY98_18035, partial [Verrucomicrobiae bacterium]|nr:hypothetical protein [Verrucomicrobiae bacterium]